MGLRVFVCGPRRGTWRVTRCQTLGLGVGKDLKWSGINSCGSVDSEWLERGRLLSSGNPGGAGGFAGILGAARRRRMTCGRTDRFRVPIDTRIISRY
jgi:hypothetical protein